MNDHDFQTIIICAFRYCLGRTTYVTDEMANILQDNISKLTDNTKAVIIKDIQYSAENNRLGMNCDRVVWLKLLEIMKNDYNE